VAKIAGIELCRAYRTQYGCNFIAAVPTNYFGPGDDFSPENSHVVGALMRRMHAAKLEGAEVIDIWGTGTPRREFIYSKDLAQACVFLLENYDGADLLNIGTGTSLSIAELAAAIGEVLGYTGTFHFDVTKPDGMPVKELDSTRLARLGWRASTPFVEAVKTTYTWFLQNTQ